MAQKQTRNIRKGWGVPKRNPAEKDLEQEVTISTSPLPEEGNATRRERSWDPRGEVKC